MAAVEARAPDPDAADARLSSRLRVLLVLVTAALAGTGGVLYVLPGAATRFPMEGSPSPS